MIDMEFKLQAWPVVVATLIDEGFIPNEAFVCYEQAWALETFESIKRDLNLIAFEHEGETYWRLSDKVVPILPNRHREAVAATA
jgi:hypothetical protein